MLQLEERNDLLVLQLAGRWMLDAQLPRFDSYMRRLRSPGRFKSLRLETQRLKEWDSSLLIFLNEVKSWCESREIDFDRESLPEGLRNLLRQTQEAVDSRVDPQDPQGIPNFATHVGNRTMHLINDCGTFADFLGEIVISFIRLLFNRSRMRWVDCIRAMQDAGAMSLPIVGLISFLVGSTLAFQAADLLGEFGSEHFTPAFVALAMVREMGPIMTAIVLAGRTSAAFAATIGSMKVAEEIDALKTLGVPPVDYLVLPRVLGLSIMMPLMVIYANALGILGGLLVGMVKLNMPVQTYMHETFLNMNEVDLGSGLLKSVVFGIIIAYAGCLRGMNCDSSSTGVGRATTSAVVTSLLMLVVANSLFAVIFSVYDI